MAKGDLIPFENAGATKMGGSIKFFVASGTTGSILAGEPVQKLAGVAGASTMPTAGPTATLRLAGVAMSLSTETVAVAGLVDVITPTPGQMWMCAPLSAAAIATQTLYNALIGKRVLFDKTAGVYTVATATVDAGSNGLIIEYSDVTRYPGMVVFSFSNVVDYRNV